MNTEQIFQALQNSGVGIGIGQSNLLFGILAQLFHITGLVLVLASILLVNLRLLGVGLVAQSTANLVRATNPLVWAGLILLVLSGLFMFIPSAGLYYPNPAFWFKFQLLAVALIIQFTLYRWITRVATPPKILAIGTAIISIFLWFSVGLAGRAIGFVAA